MVADKKKAVAAFARRLSEALTAAGIPDDGQRRRWMARKWGISTESARKWLLGFAMPDTARLPDVARDLSTSVEYLLTGKGQEGARPAAPARTASPPSEDLLEEAILVAIRGQVHAQRLLTEQQMARAIRLIYEELADGGSLRPADVVRLVRKA